MIINKTVEMPNGSVTFQGELNAQELDTVLQYGLNTLFALGALQTVRVDEADMQEPSETVQ